MLLDRGIDPNDLTSTSQTGLHWAVAKNFVSIALLLLQYGADFTIQDSHGRTSLAIARVIGNDHIFRGVERIDCKIVPVVANTLKKSSEHVPTSLTMNSISTLKELKSRAEGIYQYHQVAEIYDGSKRAIPKEEIQKRIASFATPRVFYIVLVAD
jgi:ankyrin repeat protein